VRSYRHSLQPALVLLCAIAMVAPALADPRLEPGDGSGTDNPRLLPGLYPASPQDLVALSSPPNLREPFDPLFNVDWSVALRGAYTKNSDGERFDVLLVPRVSLEQVGTRVRMQLNGEAEVAQPVNGEINVSGLRLGFDGGYRLDRETTLTGLVDLALTQDLPGAPGVASTIAVPPKTLTGAVELGVDREFGLFNVEVTGALGRTAYGTTRLNDGTVTDNSERNLWSLDSALRVGYQVTPVFEVFGRAGIGRDMFDQPSTALLVRTDATETSLRGGVAANWSDVLTAEASVGVGLRRFDEASLGEVVSQLYDASITFAPSRTWQFTAGLATNIAPPGPDAGGTARLEYAINGRVTYRVNSWLALRALADWRSATFTGSGQTERGYGFGFGADYLVNGHTALTADYGYSYAETTASGIRDSQRVTVGITMSR